MELLRKLASFFDRIINLLATVAGGLAVVVMLLVVYEVLARYIFHIAAGWVVEVCEFILLYITFLGSPWLLREGGHVSIDVILIQLNAKNKTGTKIIGNVLCVVACLIIVWYGGCVVWKHFQSDILVINTLSAPKWALLCIIPIGFFLLSIQFIRQICRQVQGRTVLQEDSKKSR